MSRFSFDGEGALPGTDPASGVLACRSTRVCFALIAGAAPPSGSGGEEPGPKTATILVWLRGGASHLETYDPKPDAPSEYRGIFNSPDLPAAQSQFKKVVAADVQIAPKLFTWMEENLPFGFTVFSLPVAHQRRLRTSNVLERVNQ